MVSIVTPVKRNSFVFATTYLSVLSQTYTEFEWLVIVDSYEGYPFLNVSEDKIDPRIRLLFNTSNERGAGPTRNVGLERTRGKFITFIDADDIWEPHFLEKSMLFLSKSNAMSCFSGYSRLLLEENRKLKDFTPSSTRVSAEDVLAGCDISCLTFLGRWNDVTNGARFGNIRARNDLVFFYSYLNCTEACAFTGLNLACYNIGKNTVSSEKFKLIRYQYLVSRKIAGLSWYASSLNVFKWAIYGIRKYWK
jgi:teichuronic acid biosynthesis glycosyltransferase TuaG